MTRATLPRLHLLPLKEYKGVTNDPIRFYFWPVFGRMYRQRVELCLAECVGGQRILEVGFGSGLTFVNLNNMYQEIHGLDLTADVNIVSSVFRTHGIRANLRQGNVTQMPYHNDYFDTVLLISILEHLKPHDLESAFSEIWRVLKPGGEVVYGVPVERPLMVFMFRLLGYDIRKEHFATEEQVADAAKKRFGQGKILEMKSFLPQFGAVYEVGHFLKTSQTAKD